MVNLSLMSDVTDMAEAGRRIRESLPDSLAAHVAPPLLVTVATRSDDLVDDDRGRSRARDCVLGWFSTLADDDPDLGFHPDALPQSLPSRSPTARWFTPTRRISTHEVLVRDAASRPR